MARHLVLSARFLASLVTLLAVFAPAPAPALARPSPAPAATIVDTQPATNQMAMASRPDVPSGAEIEAADDFILTAANQITSATFTGLLPTGQALNTVRDVVVEVYRVFPADSTNPPSGHVPTRANSPSDVAFVSRSASAGELTFTTSVLAATFTASNSVVNGINPVPRQTTGGEGPVTGQEVQFSVTFTSPFDLPPDHYFFIPQVQLSSGTVPFLWLSGQRPANFTPDLQAWIRNAALDPDWLRVGTDIVGGNTPPTFNGAFSLQGNVICTTRPNVGVAVAPSGSGRLQATLTANSNASTPGNEIREVQFTSQTGAVVQDTTGAAITVPGFVIPAVGGASFSFFVRKAAPTQAATVILTVIDGCGTWSTFVGGGPTAFPPGPPPAALAGNPATAPPPAAPPPASPSAPSVVVAPAAAPAAQPGGAALPSVAPALQAPAAVQAPPPVSQPASVAPAVAPPALQAPAAVSPPPAAVLPAVAPPPAPAPAAVMPVAPVAPASSGPAGYAPGRPGAMAAPSGPPSPWALGPWAPVPWPPQMAPGLAPYGPPPGYSPAVAPAWPAWPQVAVPALPGDDSATPEP